jgi:hypothetical protein
MARKKSIYYVDPVELLEEVKLYKSSGKCSERLGALLLLMARNFSSKGNFAGYTWRADMVSEGVLTVVKYLRSFNPEKSSNAFSYITQILTNAFRLTIINEKKNIHIKNICYYSSLHNPLDEESSYVMKSLDYEKIQNSVPEGTTSQHDINHLWVEQKPSHLQSANLPL